MAVFAVVRVSQLSQPQENTGLPSSGVLLLLDAYWHGVLQDDIILQVYLIYAYMYICVCACVRTTLYGDMFTLTKETTTILHTRNSAIPPHPSG